MTASALEMVNTRRVMLHVGEVIHRAMNSSSYDAGFGEGLGEVVKERIGDYLDHLKTKGAVRGGSCEANGTVNRWTMFRDGSIIFTTDKDVQIEPTTFSGRPKKYYGRRRHRTWAKGIIGRDMFTLLVQTIAPISYVTLTMIRVPYAGEAVKEEVPDTQPTKEENENG